MENVKQALVPEPPAHSVGVRTMVVQHPQAKTRWCVMATVMGPSGNHLYISNETFIFESSAVKFMEGTLDENIAAALKKFKGLADKDPFDVLDNELAISMRRLATQWIEGAEQGGAYVYED